MNPTNPIAASWSANADKLADWALARLFVRTDRFGGYYVKDGETQKVSRPRTATPDAVCPTLLRKHFRAQGTNDVVGSYFLTPEPNSIGHAAAADIDAHDENADLARNERYALHCYSKLASIGFLPLLATWGRGSFHLLTLFDRDVPGELLFNFGRWMVTDAAEFGYASPVESFPKQPTVPVEGYGNWLRVIGRHHTRPVWATVWDGVKWLEGAAAVAHILSLTGDPPDLIPIEARSVPKNRKATVPDTTKTTHSEVSDVFDVYNRTITLHTVIRWHEDKGHKITKEGTDRVELLRDGKSGSGQSFNVAMRDGIPVTFNFSTNAGLPAGKGLSPSQVRCFYECGDCDTTAMSKFASRLRKELGWVAPSRNGTCKAHTCPTAVEIPAQRSESRPLVSANSSSECGDIVVESLEGLRPKPVRWLVPSRIPMGMIGLLAGEGGHGKSMTTLELAAALSVGRCAFGLSYPNPVCGKTLLISCEDDWERTIVPRLAALGADLNKILRTPGVKMKKDERTLDFDLGRYRELEKLFDTDKEIRLVSIDPAGAYIGRSGVNEHKDAELRMILDPLSQIANKSGATILLVKHLNKSANASAVQRVSGSAGYVNAVRFAYMIGPDEDDPDKKLMLAIKSNILPAGRTGLAYRLKTISDEEGRKILLTMWPDLNSEDLSELSKQLFRQEWEDGITTDPNTFGRGAKKDGPNKVNKCIAWVREFLNVYAYPSGEICEAAKRNGFTFDNVKEAKATLKSEGLRNSNLGRLRGVWWSGFGLPPEWTLRPDTRSFLAPHTPDSPHTYDSPHSPHSRNSSLPEREEREESGESGEQVGSGEPVPQ
jgi:hypothetical protein